MTIELRLLAYSIVLLFVLINVQALTAVKAQGGPAMAGNRDSLAPPTTYEGRTRRTLYNHIEALAMFAPLALIAAVSHVSNDMTVLGARLFFYGRVLYSLTYLIGIPYLRSAFWFVGVVGTVLIFLALFGIV